MLTEGVILFAAVLGLQALLARTVDRELAAIRVHAREDGRVLTRS